MFRDKYLTRNWKMTTKKCPFTCYITKKWPKKQSDFEYWAVLTHFALFWGLVRPFIGNLICLRTLFGQFCGWSYYVCRDICLQTCCNTMKWSKKQSDFEYCAVLTHSAQFWVLVWPFLGNMTCLKTLFGLFQGIIFQFGIDNNDF